MQKTTIKSNILLRIQKKFEKLNKHRPLPKESVKKLRERFSIEMTYNSNAIEGNTLTLKETYFIIQEGITIKGKSMREHLEAKDHFEAIEYLYKSLESQEPFTEHFIRSLQSLVVKNNEPDAGSYRSTNVGISGSTHRPPESFEVPILMREFVKFINDKETTMHPIDRATVAHHKFVHIHPFSDGNGRTARLLMNFILMRAKYPMTILLKNDRKKYYDALSKADRGNILPLIGFISQSVERSLDLYLDAIAPPKNLEEKLLPLTEVAKHTPYSSSYLHILIKRNKIAGTKIGRNWQTSIKEIKNYISLNKKNK